MSEANDAPTRDDGGENRGVARKINDTAAIVTAVGVLATSLETNLRQEWMKVLRPIAGVSPFVYIPVLLSLLLIALQFRRVRPGFRWLVARAQTFGTKYEGAITFFNFVCLLCAICAASALAYTVSKQLALNESVATKYVTQFPGNIHFINRLLSEVKEGDVVSIVIDFPAYGTVTAPVEARETVDWLKQIVVKKNVRLTIVYSTLLHSVDALKEGNREMEPALKCVNNQRTELAGGRTCDDIALVNKLHDYLESRRRAGRPGAFNTVEDLNNAFVEDDVKLIDDLFATRVESTQVTACPILSATPPAYIWMIRGKQAVFAFAGGKENDTFVTYDTRVLQAFDALITNTVPADEKGCRSLPNKAGHRS